MPGPRHYLGVKILVVGSGGREHALAWKLKQAKAVDRIFCAPGNAGTATVAENIQVPATDLNQLRQFAKQNGIDLTVVGPDDPLALGIVDLFNADNLRIFGPTKSAARLESSKIFAKELMRARGVPTARARTFSDSNQALDYSKDLNFPVVIKADGLALGKGVVIASNLAEATAAIAAMMNEARFGDAGRRIVIEEFLRGTECSLHALVDGKNYRLLESARDHKRAFDGDEGPNTGGMGCFSPVAGWGADAVEEALDLAHRPVLAELAARGAPFVGVLYAGLMLTADGPRVLEFNCRFGDPETQSILPLVDGDLLGALWAATRGELAGAALAVPDRAAVTVVLSAGGYPEAVDTGSPIEGIGDAESVGALVFHAGTALRDGSVVTNGGRILGVTGVAPTLAEARERAYAGANLISFPGVRYRSDIAGEAAGG